VKRLCCLVATAVLLLAVVLYGRDASQLTGGTKSGLEVQVEPKNPWTHLRLNNDPALFRFAIVSDRTGGHRAGIFAQAVEQLNWLQPEFVLSVGDLIEGNKKEKLAEEWQEFEGMVKKLKMPFFYAPGNHDYWSIRTPAWNERFGRSHYHFSYKGVLFLILNSNIENEKGKLGKAQLDYVRQTLKDTASARWTVVILHHALWAIPEFDKSYSDQDWQAVEQMLAGRKYTVFCGHGHTYHKWVRNGMNYYMLATTGGASPLTGVRFGAFDHITWVTMRPNGPVMANLLLDGIYPEDLLLPRVEESAGSGNDPRTIPWPRVELRVLLDGKPAAGKLVRLHRLVDGKPHPNGDLVIGYVGADGNVVTMFDRVMAGENAVTVTDYKGQFAGRPADEEVKALRSPPVPEVYADPLKSGLRVEVRGDRNTVNRFTLELKSRPR
jgi:hypothetical protein